MKNKALIFRQQGLTGPTYGKQIAWPMYAWRVILPERAASHLDALEKLVLKVAQITNPKQTNIFEEIGIAKELLDTILKACTDRGYLKNNELTERGLKILQGETSITQNMYDRQIQMYIFVDAVNGDVIPTFGIDRLPKKRLLDFDLVLNADSKHKRKPNIFEIENKMKYAKGLRKFVDNLKRNQDNGEVFPEQIQHDEEQFNAIMQDFGLDDLFSDSMDKAPQAEQQESTNVDTIIDLEPLDDLNGIQQLDGTFKANQETTKPEQSKKVTNMVQLQSNKQYNLKILDDAPTLVYLPVTVYGNADTFMNDKLYVISPFSEYEDQWFYTTFMFMNKLNNQVKDFKEQLFIEMQEQFKHRYAFSNEMKILVLDEFPLVANDTKWRKLREQIEEREHAYLRMKTNDKDYDSFIMRTQRMLEFVFYKIFETLELTSLKGMIQNYNYRQMLQKISDDLAITIPQKYYSMSFVSKLVNKIERNYGFSSSKDAALLYVIYVYFNREVQHLEVLRQLPHLLQTIELIVDERNINVHYSDANTSNEAIYAQIYEQSEQILMVLIRHILIRNE